MIGSYPISHNGLQYQSVTVSINPSLNRSPAQSVYHNLSHFESVLVSVFCSSSNAPNQSRSQSILFSSSLCFNWSCPNNPFPSLSTHLQDVAGSPSRSISLHLDLSLTVLMWSRSPASFAFQVPWPFVNLSWILGLLLLEKSRVLPSEHVENNDALSHHFGHTVIMSYICP